MLYVYIFEYRENPSEHLSTSRGIRYFSRATDYRFVFRIKAQSLCNGQYPTHARLDLLSTISMSTRKGKDTSNMLTNDAIFSVIKHYTEPTHPVFAVDPL